MPPKSQILHIRYSVAINELGLLLNVPFYMCRKPDILWMGLLIELWDCHLALSLEVDTYQLL